MPSYDSFGPHRQTTLEDPPETVELIKQAEKIARKNRHRLSRWGHLNRGGREALCIRCSDEVLIRPDEDPPIRGSAIERTCCGKLPY